MPHQKALLHSALFPFSSGLFVLGALLFSSAGTWAYPQAWLFLTLVSAPMLALLVRHRQIAEQKGAQSCVVTFASVLFLCVFVLSGMDFRIGWTRVPVWLTAAASGVLLVSCALCASAMRESTPFSRMASAPQAVDVGLYGVVRHPIYAATIALFLAIPLVLGSFIAFAVMLLYPPLTVICIYREEKQLARTLTGYADYQKRVKYRLIPFIW